MTARGPACIRNKPDSTQQAAENKRGVRQSLATTHCSALTASQQPARSWRQNSGQKMQLFPLSESETQELQAVLLQKWSSNSKCEKAGQNVSRTGECPTCPHSPWLVSDIFIADLVRIRPSGEPHLRVRLCRHHRHPWLCSLLVWSGSSGNRLYHPCSPVLRVLENRLSRACQAEKESATRGERVYRAKASKVSACDLDLCLKLASPLLFLPRFVVCR